MNSDFVSIFFIFPYHQHGTTISKEYETFCLMDFMEDYFGVLFNSIDDCYQYLAICYGIYITAVRGEDRKTYNPLTQFDCYSLNACGTPKRIADCKRIERRMVKRKHSLEVFEKELYNHFKDYIG